MNQSKEIGEGFSSIDLVGQCLIDEEKATMFETAIKNAVAPDSVVLELGTGSGLLSMMAVRAGAKKVFAVEFDPYIASVAKQNFINNNLENKIELIIGDARTIDLAKYFEKIDVVIMEMLSTGMVDEYQVQAINNLHKQKLIDNKTKLIPERQETNITLASTNFEISGFQMKMVRHLWQHDHNIDLIDKLSDTQILNSIDFYKPINEHYSSTISFKASKSGLLNSIYLNSKAIVNQHDNLFLESTHSMNPIVIVPLKDMEVKIEDKIKIKIDYDFGEGYNSFIVQQTD
jgi:predicted RNA methylase